jgi:hypothetical protein
MLKLFIHRRARQIRSTFWKCFYIPRVPAIWTTIKAFFISTPAIVIAYVTFDFKSAAPPGQLALLGYLAVHQSLFVGLLLAPAIMMVAFDVWEFWCKRFEKNADPDKDEFAIILHGIDSILGHKFRRIADYAAKVRSGRGKRLEAFNAIVDPASQIQENMVQLYYTIRELTDDASLKIVLVPIINGDPTGYATYLPKDAIPSEEMIAVTPRKTLFFHAARDKCFKVIEDLDEYIRMTPSGQREYCPSSNDGDSGSIACFPVIHPHFGKVVYALSLKSDNRGVFNKANVKKYKTTCEYFTKRILMEHTLDMIVKQTDL